jgi:hypothetical protein
MAASSPALLDHLARRGINSSQVRAANQDDNLFQRYAGANAGSYYAPFGSDMYERTPANQKKEIADYVIGNVQFQYKLRNNATQSGMTLATRAVKPKLVSDVEMARRGMTINTTGQIPNPLYQGTIVSEVEGDVAYQLMPPKTSTSVGIFDRNAK